MFKKLQEIWQREDLFNQSLGTLEIMLKKNKKTFKLVTDALIEKREINRDIYKDDQEINCYEMEIRKKILEHISICPEQDITFALILLGATRDVERTGDYCKNIYELSLKYPNKISDDKYSIVLKDTIKQIFEMFDLATAAFIGQKKEMAKRVMDTHHEDISPKMEKLTGDIIDDGEIKAREAVVYALLARHLKRISAHLANISSGVVNPFQRVRYVPEDRCTDL